MKKVIRIRCPYCDRPFMTREGAAIHISAHIRKAEKIFEATSKEEGMNIVKKETKP